MVEKVARALWRVDRERGWRGGYDRARRRRLTFDDFREQYIEDAEAAVEAIRPFALGLALTEEGLTDAIGQKGGLARFDSPEGHRQLARLILSKLRGSGTQGEER